LLINNPIKFIKNDIINKAKKEIIELDEDSDSSSSVSSDSSDSSGSGSKPKESKQEKKKEKIIQKKTPMQLVKESLPIFKYK
jgi:hypothetical protein